MSNITPSDGYEEKESGIKGQRQRWCFRVREGPFAGATSFFVAPTQASMTSLQKDSKIGFPLQTML